MKLPIPLLKLNLGFSPTEKIIMENVIIHKDCMDVMKNMKNNEIDCIITDPPYGITNSDWDKIPDKKYFDEMFRVSKNQIIFGGNFFDLPRKGGWIIWYKRPFLKRTNPIEMIWTSFDMYNQMLDYTYAGNCEGFHGEKLKPNYKKKKVFFTSEKPIAVIRWLLENFTKENDLIFDPFAGTGSVMIACIETNRRYIIVEKELSHFEYIKERAKTQTLLSQSANAESLIRDKRETSTEVSPNSNPSDLNSRGKSADFQPEPLRVVYP